MPDVSNLSRKQLPRGSPVSMLVVLDLSTTCRIVDTSAMAPFRIVLDAVWRVRDHQLWRNTSQQSLHEACIGAVSARDSVRSQLPDFAQFRYGNVSGCRNLVLVRQPAGTRRKGGCQFFTAEAEN